MRDLGGCTLRELKPEPAARWMEWLDGAPAPEDANAHYRWLLAHCDDGVIWGRRGGTDQPWCLSGHMFSHFSPQLTVENLQTLRIFGATGEALFWREGGSIRGRILADTDPLSVEDPLRPADESYLLLGDKVVKPPQDGFTVIVDATGSRQVLPLVLTPDHLGNGRAPRLRVRHYFEADPKSGAVRIAASRLVEVRER